MKHEYTGFTLPAENASIDRRHLSELTPRQFFDEYVKLRKPVVLLHGMQRSMQRKGGNVDDTDGIDGTDGNVSWLRGFSRWSSNEYLRVKAGRELVQVERRAKGVAAAHPKGGNVFGRGSSEVVRFGEFIRRLESGDPTWYLTTQQLPVDAPARAKPVSLIEFE